MESSELIEEYYKQISFIKLQHSAARERYFDELNTIIEQLQQDFDDTNYERTN